MDYTNKTEKVKKKKVNNDKTVLPSKEHKQTKKIQKVRKPCCQAKLANLGMCLPSVQVLDLCETAFFPASWNCTNFLFIWGFSAEILVRNTSLYCLGAALPEVETLDDWETL